MAHSIEMSHFYIQSLASIEKKTKKFDLILT